MPGIEATKQNCSPYLGVPFKKKLLLISRSPLQKETSHHFHCFKVEELNIIIHPIFQEPSDPSEHLAEEEVARLSGELEWLREETRHGDRKLEELQDQVLLHER